MYCGHAITILLNRKDPQTSISHFQMKEEFKRKLYKYICDCLNKNKTSMIFVNALRNINYFLESSLKLLYKLAFLFYKQTG